MSSRSAKDSRAAGSLARRAPTRASGRREAGCEVPHDSGSGRASLAHRARALRDPQVLSAGTHRREHRYLRLSPSPGMTSQPSTRSIRVCAATLTPMLFGRRRAAARTRRCRKFDCATGRCSLASTLLAAGTVPERNLESTGDVGELLAHGAWTLAE